jgi:hypothetical protein
MLVFYLLFDFAPPKNNDIAILRASRSSRLPSTVPLVAAACFWLVVASKIIALRPQKATMYFPLFIFSSFIRHPKRLDGLPPRAPHQARLHSVICPIVSADFGLIVALNHQTAAT